MSLQRLLTSSSANRRNLDDVSKVLKRCAPCSVFHFAWLLHQQLADLRCINLSTVQFSGENPHSVHVSGRRDLQFLVFHQLSSFISCDGENLDSEMACKTISAPPGVLHGSRFGISIAIPNHISTRSQLVHFLARHLPSRTPAGAAASRCRASRRARRSSASRRRRTRSSSSSAAARRAAAAPGEARFAPATAMR